MIKKIICYLRGHNLSETPYLIRNHNGESKVIIPIHELCFRCKKIIDRPLNDYEIPFVITGKAIYDSIKQDKREISL